MDTDENAGCPIIELYIAPDYDANTHRIFCYAPDGWDTMTEEERVKFLDEESLLYLHERVEFGALVHDDAEAAAEATRGSWGDGFSPEGIEERWSTWAGKHT